MMAACTSEEHWMNVFVFNEYFPEIKQYAGGGPANNHLFLSYTRSQAQPQHIYDGCQRSLSLYYIGTLYVAILRKETGTVRKHQEVYKRFISSVIRRLNLSKWMFLLMLRSYRGFLIWIANNKPWNIYGTWVFKLMYFFTNFTQK